MRHLSYDCEDVDDNADEQEGEREGLDVDCDGLDDLLEDLIADDDVEQSEHEDEGRVQQAQRADCEVGEVVDEPNIDLQEQQRRAQHHVHPQLAATRRLRRCECSTARVL